MGSTFKAQNFKYLTAFLMMLSLSYSHALEQQTLTMRSLPVFFDLEATLEAVNQSTVSAQTSGAIVEITVDVNDRVEAGALLVRIDDVQQTAQVQQANANLAYAQAENKDAQRALERTHRLREQGSVSQGELDRSEARSKSTAASVAAAQAALKQAKEQLAYTQVRAPYAGIVKQRYVELGELVHSGQPLMTGMALAPLRVVADMPQRVAQAYQTPSQMTVVLNDEDITPSKVTVFPFADAQLHSVRVRAELDESNGGIPGQWAKLRVKTAERDAILVPERAILQRSELAAVYVLQDERPQLRQVRLGNRYGQHIEVLAGLKVGERIITDALAQRAALAKEE